MPLINRVGGGSAELQSKTVKPTTSEQKITPDDGYDGLSDVIVNAMKLQTRAVTPTTSSQTITPSSLYDGLAKVTVNAISTQSKTVAPTSESQTVYPDSGKYLSSVVVNGFKSIGIPVKCTSVENNYCSLCFEDTSGNLQDIRGFIIFNTDHYDRSNHPWYTNNNCVVQVINTVMWLADGITLKLQDYNHTSTVFLIGDENPLLSNDMVVNGDLLTITHDSTSVTVSVPLNYPGDADICWGFAHSCDYVLIPIY